MTQIAQIHLNQLQLSVRLGWPQDERSRTQWITLDIKLQFDHPPRGCRTDQLEDTICYDQLIQQIKCFLKQRSFRLIEHFTSELYLFIKKIISHKILLQLSITKKPSIPQLTEGVSFCYGDIF